MASLGKFADPFDSFPSFRLPLLGKPDSLNCTSPHSMKLAASSMEEEGSSSLQSLKSSYQQCSSSLFP